VARVFWYGDAGAHTGFARVTHAIAGGLARKYGHELSVLALNYSGDYMPETEGLRLYKADARDPVDSFGSRRIVEVLRIAQPEVVVLMHDPTGIYQLLFDNPFDRNRELLNSAPILAYLPVDGYDYPPVLTEILPETTNIIVPSHHGQTVFPTSKVVYHGVDTETFWPITEKPIDLGGPVLTTKAECKALLGYPEDSFLVLRVDMNSGRKDIAATVQALAPFMERHRDVYLHLHAAADARMPGVRIPALVSRYDFAEGQVRIPILNGTTGWDETRMNVLYNAADLFVSTSRGEGFGLGIAEALSCGVPVIAQNCSAIPEVVGPGGVLIEPERRITVPAGQDLWLPNIPAFTDAVERLYTNQVWRTELGLAGRKHVTESFSWTYATDRFNDFIEHAARWRASTEAN
jgi:glycosyltransferase involved in cell wall biosynthesis